MSNRKNTFKPRRIGHSAKQNIDLTRSLTGPRPRVLAGHVPSHSAPNEDLARQVASTQAPGGKNTRMTIA